MQTDSRISLTSDTIYDTLLPKKERLMEIRLKKYPQKYLRSVDEYTVADCIGLSMRFPGWKVILSPLPVRKTDTAIKLLIIA